MRSSFQLDQGVSVIADGKYYDLHNCFDFVGYEHRPAEKKLRLEWLRSPGEWVSADIPVGLVLFFEGVTNFAVQKRDGDMPFTEDNCVSNISFLPPELSDRYDAMCPDHRSHDEHLSLSFQSGASMKIWAESVTHQSKSAEPRRPENNAWDVT